jgi:dephospho-CoA kinase
LSRWPGKYIIGLTGNIGTGKSVVRRMLEHLGAYGIDADTLAHRVIAKGAPGYKPVVDMFGNWILDQAGEIDRKKLGKIVFNDPEALSRLENIVHPYVFQALDYIIQRSKQPVVVIEAIKLLETDLHRSCDTIWVVDTSPEVQLARLMRTRHISEADARQRMASQAPQEKKIAAAKVVIQNQGTFEDTWKQVMAAWQQMSRRVAVLPTRELPRTAVLPGKLNVTRARPRESDEIAALFNRLRKDANLTRADVMAAFGEKAFLLLRSGNRLVGLLAWQVENLVARTTDILIDPTVPTNQALKSLTEEMERASRDLQCEASLVFVPTNLSGDHSLWDGLGYQQRTMQSLGVLAWQEAARESNLPGTEIFFKQLRIDRVLRPI